MASCNTSFADQGCDTATGRTQNSVFTIAKNGNQVRFGAVKPSCQGRCSRPDTGPVTQVTAAHAHVESRLASSRVSPS